MEEKRSFSLGVLGLGHWFTSLYAGLVRSNDRVVLRKVAAASDVGSKLERLKDIGVSPSDYYRIEAFKPIPDAFFEGLDIVHVSDPNEYHAAQTIQALENGKITVTEKTFGINKEEHDQVMKYIKANKCQHRVYLHLHYLHKQLSKKLPTLLGQYTKEYGMIKSVSATFYEVVNEDDARRKRWLFSLKSGGLFMDWIHPFEIIAVNGKARKIELEDVSLYTTNPEYDLENPTGIESRVKIAGKMYAPDAYGVIRVAKGTPKGKKAMRFNFESGAHLDLNYLGHEEEFSSDKRGGWELVGADGEVIASDAPKGRDTSEILVRDIIRMCEGKHAGLKMAEIKRIYAPQWKYQKICKGKQPVSETSEVESFIAKGLSLSA